MKVEYVPYEAYFVSLKANMTMEGKYDCPKRGICAMKGKFVCRERRFR